MRNYSENRLNSCFIGAIMFIYLKDSLTCKVLQLYIAFFALSLSRIFQPKFDMKDVLMRNFKGR